MPAPMTTTRAELGTSLTDPVSSWDAYTVQWTAHRTTEHCFSQDVFTDSIRSEFALSTNRATEWHAEEP
jgi:hypothetical protein